MRVTYFIQLLRSKSSLLEDQTVRENRQQGHISLKLVINDITNLEQSVTEKWGYM